MASRLKARKKRTIFRKGRRRAYCFQCVALFFNFYNEYIIILSSTYIEQGGDQTGFCITFSCKEGQFCKNWPKGHQKDAISAPSDHFAAVEKYT